MEFKFKIFFKTAWFFIMIVLFENVIGFSIFQCSKEFSIELNSPKIQDQLSIYSNFCKYFKLKTFIPFTSLQHSLENCIFISNGVATTFLLEFLLNMCERRMIMKNLGIIEPKLATFIRQKSIVKTFSSETLFEYCRIIRFHFEKFSKNFFCREIQKAQCGISHLFSQSKMKIDLRKADGMIIQSNLLIEQFDKDLNFFSMISKEWYSWYFPELAKIISDPYLFSLIIRFLGNKDKFPKKKLGELKMLVLSETICRTIIKGIKNSIGFEISITDLRIIEKISESVILMAEFRDKLILYMHKKIQLISPNLMELVGEKIAANMISKAGSLKNLARYPASTVQILGSEKALFRSLKAKAKTPKFGILFNSSFISKTKFSNRGKISRFLANKCSLAIRIDYFSPVCTSFYGKKLKKQLENKFKDLNQY